MTDHTEERDEDKFWDDFDSKDKFWDDFEAHNPVKDEFGENLDVDPRSNRSYTHEDLVRIDGERRLWTLVDDDDGDVIPVRGYHIVNRISHHECEKPYQQEGVVS